MREPGEPSKPRTSGPPTSAPAGTMSVGFAVLRSTPSTVPPISAVRNFASWPSRPSTIKSAACPRSTMRSSAIPRSVSTLHSSPFWRASSPTRRVTPSARARRNASTPSVLGAGTPRLSARSPWTTRSSITVTPCRRARKRAARATPKRSAALAASDPSVAIRIDSIIRFSALARPGVPYRS